jgi:hypothetical protein
MSEAITLEAVLKRDRAIVLAGVAGLSALAWAYILVLAWWMPHEDRTMAMAMPHMHAWGAAEVFLTWVMWAVMMVAMMTLSRITEKRPLTMLEKSPPLGYDPSEGSGLFSNPAFCFSRSRYDSPLILITTL